jgi:hypothetical protein
MSAFWSKIAELWCTLMHPAPMWPFRGHYRCPKCLREHRIDWEYAQPAMAARATGANGCTTMCTVTASCDPRDPFVPHPR